MIKIKKKTVRQPSHIKRNMLVIFDTPPIDSPLHYHLRHASHFGKITVGKKKVILLGDAW
jgi:hypothetical protein